MFRMLPNSARVPYSSSAIALFSQRLASNTKPFLFNEDDLTEQFVRGWGPGGQKINKTANCVVLKHNPTGIIVKCQETRELHRNRELARRWLNQKLDLHLNGSESEVARLQREVEAQERQRHMKAKRRLAAKLEFKIREGLARKPNRNELDPKSDKPLT